MTSEGKEMAVGVLVLAGIVLALLYTYALDRAVSAGGYTVTATFNRVDGLVPGDAVQMAGIPVGAVEDMGLDEHYRAVLTLRLNDGLVIPTDTAVAIHTNGLFGSKYVVLDAGGAETGLKPGDRISYTQDAVLVDELLELIIAQGKANRKRPDDRLADPDKGER